MLRYVNCFKRIYIHTYIYTYCRCTTLQKKSVAKITTTKQLHFCVVQTNKTSTLSAQLLHLIQNIRANVQNVFIFHLHRPEVSCAIHQQHRPQCFAISHSKCQSSTVSDRPLPELVSDTHDLASRPIFDSQLRLRSGILGGHKSGGMNFGVSRCRSSIV